MTKNKYENLTLFSEGSFGSLIPGVHVMATLRILAVFFAVASVGFAGELATLDGKKSNGDIVSVTGNELTFKTAAGEEKYIITTINSITVGPAPKSPAAGLKFISVELTDGSSFRCETYTVDGKDVEMKLLGGRTIRVPMTTVFTMLRDAGNVKIEQDFRGILRTRGKFDLIVTRRTGTDGQDFLDVIPGTFGEGNKAKEEIKFRQEGATEDTNLPMNRASGGMIFNQIAGVKVAATICRVVDTDGNVYAAQAIARTTKGYTVTTVTNVKFDLEDSVVSKFDFAAGSVKYLSDLVPAKVIEEGSDPHPYQKDRNLDRQQIELVLDPVTGKREKYAKGLTIHAKTILVYDLNAQYKTFSAIAGVDADKQNEADSKVKLTIDDGMVVLFTKVIKKGEKPVELNFSVQNTAQIRITVESADPAGLDLGNHISLANVRVLK
jgi:hypothetical protein